MKARFQIVHNLGAARDRFRIIDNNKNDDKFMLDLHEQYALVNARLGEFPGQKSVH